MSSTAEKIPVTTKYPTDHDKSVKVSLNGVTVTLTLRSLEYAEQTGTDPDTVLVFIDTTDRETPLSVMINDSDPIFEEVVR